MKWQGRRGSSNVEDRRGRGGKGVVGGGIGIILLIIITLMGGDPGQIMDMMQGANTGTVAPYEETTAEKELAQFVSVVLADTEDVWTEIFRQEGAEYLPPKLVLYSGTVDSACGYAGASSGPFYCPGDQKVYIDLSFYNDLQEKFKAPGDFAMAYVIAHEVGHHVQNLSGTMDKMNKLRPQLSQTEYNEYSVRLELQADYLAGVWARYAQGMGYLEAGDIEEALTAASAVGDDRIQKQSQGYIVPDSFTHGTSEQRVRWFKKGFQAGDLSGWDTFSIQNP